MMYWIVGEGRCVWVGLAVVQRLRVGIEIGIGVGVGIGIGIEVIVGGLVPTRSELVVGEEMFEWVFVGIVVVA